ncbi:Fc.00g003970.m01.CDS01 [Cosmosporella sp. VM-42]
MAVEPSLPYHEPPIITIVILSGFLLLLNVINYGLDKLVYCGLIGQVFVGIAWGTPGAKWVSREVEDAVMQLGYLGLILIVYQGGLSTSFGSLKANLGLSAGVALTGIGVPMGLSFVLQSMLGASPLQAFASGAALCSTSLGTTFTILGTSGLSSTRLGVVLTSAAMMDDVVGLIMVQVVSNLGDGAFDAITVVRPVLVSIAFSTLVPVLCKILVEPITLKLNALREAKLGSRLDRALRSREAAFVIHTLLLLALVIGGTFAGTSSLLAVYIAGATSSWWDSEVAHVSIRAVSGAEVSETEDPASGSTNSTVAANMSAENMRLSLEGGAHYSGSSGMYVYDHYYKAAVERILKPFFFASIGFSVPITKMFSVPVVWRGVVYTILMATGKLLCGIWLIPFVNPLKSLKLLSKKAIVLGKHQSKTLVPGAQCNDADSLSAGQSKSVERNATVNLQMEELPDTPRPDPALLNSSPKPKKPLSLYPASILAFGMVARGEIGFLIAALAESKGILGHEAGGPPSKLFLVVTWAISLCTIIGPIGVGLMVNRVKQLELGKGKRGTEGERNVLGAWGVA